MFKGFEGGTASAAVVPVAAGAGAVAVGAGVGTGRLPPGHGRRILAGGLALKAAAVVAAAGVAGGVGVDGLESSTRSQRSRSPPAASSPASVSDRSRRVVSRCPGTASRVESRPRRADEGEDDGARRTARAQDAEGEPRTAARGSPSARRSASGAGRGARRQGARARRARADADDVDHDRSPSKGDTDDRAVKPPRGEAPGTSPRRVLPRSRPPGRRPEAASRRPAARSSLRRSSPVRGESAPRERPISFPRMRFSPHSPSRSTAVLRRRRATAAPAADQGRAPRRCSRRPSCAR